MLYNDWNRQTIQLEVSDHYEVAATYEKLTIKEHDHSVLGELHKRCRTYELQVLSSINLMICSFSFSQQIVRWVY